MGRPSQELAVKFCSLRVKLVETRPDLVELWATTVGNWFTNISMMICQFTWYLYDYQRLIPCLGITFRAQNTQNLV